MNIADRIQNLRKARGISQEELADKIEVSRQAVSKWESEQSTPDIETENRTAGKWCSHTSFPGSLCPMGEHAAYFGHL